MKLDNNKKIAFIPFALIVGLLFASYILYEQHGTLLFTDIIALCLAAIFGIIILIVIIKKLKNDN